MLPDDRGLAANLEVIDFRGNAFFAMIPIQLGSLSKLSVLSFEGNAFDGTIPSEVLVYPEW
jgi:hypothetical protein